MISNVIFSSSQYLKDCYDIIVGIENIAILDKIKSCSSITKIFYVLSSF